MKTLYIVIIFIIILITPVFGLDADLWEILDYNGKIAFVAGMRSGFLAATNLANTAYYNINESSKDLPEDEGKQKSKGAYEVYNTFSIMSIYLSLDETWVEDFVKYLDYYFTIPNNKNAFDAFNKFSYERIKSNAD